MSKAWVCEVEEDLTIMKAPPPIPLAIGLTTPTHNAVATAASTACPPCLSMDAPISEQRSSSAATTPCSDSTISVLSAPIFVSYLLPPLSAQELRSLPLTIRPTTETQIACPWLNI